MSIKHHSTRRGDTIIEVMFGIAIFGLVAIMTINLMNNGLAGSEANLESTMARNEMNAQAEALRYIHSTYSFSNGVAFGNIWNAITTTGDTSMTTPANSFEPSEGGSDCETFYNHDVREYHGFALDTSSIRGGSAGSIIKTDQLAQAETYPIVRSDRAEGIWINAVADNSDEQPNYYDFYIRSCWYGLGSNMPTTLDTVVRLYNPNRSS